MNRDALIASLGQVTDTDCLSFGDDDPRYLDWSSRNVDGGAVFEIGDDNGSANVALTRDEIVELHKRLTLWLLGTQV